MGVLQKYCLQNTPHDEMTMKGPYQMSHNIHFINVNITYAPFIRVVCVCGRSKKGSNEFQKELHPLSKTDDRCSPTLYGLFLGLFQNSCDEFHAYLCQDSVPSVS